MSDAPTPNTADLSPSANATDATGGATPASPAPTAPAAPRTLSRSRRVVFGLVRWLARGLVVSTALVLLFSGLMKLFEPGEFAAALASHNLFPRAWVATPGASDLPSPAWATWTIASAELGAGLGALLFALGGRWRSATLPMLVMLAALAGYAIALAVRPPGAGPVLCGCPLAPAVVEDWTPLALRNVLWTLALAGAWAGVR
ncbi:MAG: hypothetical protein SFY95_05340, partial [Planctomycetota bacterium]|nr:hypothetical protein [Planctomycetota bacterium]